MPVWDANNAVASAASTLFVVMAIWMLAVVLLRVIPNFPEGTTSIGEELVCGFVIAVLAGLQEALIGGFLPVITPVGSLTLLLVILIAYRAAMRWFWPL